MWSGYARYANAFCKFTDANLCNKTVMHLSHQTLQLLQPFPEALHLDKYILRFALPMPWLLKQIADIRMV